MIPITVLQKKMAIRELIAGYKAVFSEDDSDTKKLLLHFMEIDLRAKGYQVVKGEDEVLIQKIQKERKA